MKRLALATLCSTAPMAAFADAPLNLVATTSMIADALREIGGEHVEVTALMGAGVDPHGYRQTRTDIVKMTSADAIFFHGLNLEAQLTDLLAEMGALKPVHALAENVEQSKLHAEAEGLFDPHIWMDPKLWSEVVAAASDALETLDPENAALYEGNAKAYLAKLGELEMYSQSALATVPQKVLVTAHDAFGYFGSSYGFEVQGIQGLSTESEAGLARIEEMVRSLTEAQVSAIFIESSVSDRNIKALIEGAAARGHSLAIGGELFSDAMGQEGSYEGTYLGMIDHNITTITRALGGTAPEKGRLGLLGE